MTNEIFRSPALVDVLKFLGPRFRPVSSREIADKRDILPSSAAALVRKLVMPREANAALTGPRGTVIKVNQHLWGITEYGQSVLGLERTAELEYIEWLSVLADTLHGDEGEANFARSVMTHVIWKRRGANKENRLAFEKLALQVIGALCRSRFMLERHPSSKTLGIVCRATYSIRSVSCARLASGLITDAIKDQKDLGRTESIHQLFWAERHLLLVLRGVQ